VLIPPLAPSRPRDAPTRDGPPAAILRASATRPPRLARTVPGCRRDDRRRECPHRTRPDRHATILGGPGRTPAASATPVLWMPTQPPSGYRQDRPRAAPSTPRPASASLVAHARVRAGQARRHLRRSCQWHRSRGGPDFDGTRPHHLHPRHPLQPRYGLPPARPIRRSPTLLRSFGSYGRTPASSSIHGCRCDHRPRRCGGSRPSASTSANTAATTASGAFAATPSSSFPLAPLAPAPIRRRSSSTAPSSIAIARVPTGDPTELVVTTPATTASGASPRRQTHAWIGSPALPAMPSASSATPTASALLADGTALSPNTATTACSGSTSPPAAALQSGAAPGRAEGDLATPGHRRHRRPYLVLDTGNNRLVSSQHPRAALIPIPRPSPPCS